MLSEHSCAATSICSIVVPSVLWGCRDMSEEGIGHRRLTKALLLSVTLGVLPLATVGCVPVGDGSTLSASERQQYLATLRSGGPQNVDAFLSTYPNSRYAPALLNELPPRILARLSPSVLAKLSLEVVALLSPAVRAQLRLSDVGRASPSADKSISDVPVEQFSSHASRGS